RPDERLVITPLARIDRVAALTATEPASPPLWLELTMPVTELVELPSMVNSPVTTTEMAPPRPVDSALLTRVAPVDGKSWPAVTAICPESPVPALPTATALPASTETIPPGAV